MGARVVGEALSSESMKRLILPLAFALLGYDLNGSTVDLTPRYVDTEIDGIKFRRLYFTEDGKKIGISLDRETDVTADPGGGVIFRFPKVPDASFRMTRSPIGADRPMSEGSMEQYREAAKALVPSGVTDVVISEETTNPLPINRWVSQRFVITYLAGAAVMKQSVTFLNLNPETQVVLVTNASGKNFAEAAERSFQIIRTWHEVLPEDESRVTIN